MIAFREGNLEAHGERVRVGGFRGEQSVQHDLRALGLLRGVELEARAGEAQVAREGGVASSVRPLNAEHEQRSALREQSRLTVALLEERLEHDRGLGRVLPRAFVEELPQRVGCLDRTTGTCQRLSAHPSEVEAEAISLADLRGDPLHLVDPAVSSQIDDSLDQRDRLGSICCPDQQPFGHRQERVARSAA